MLDKIKNLNMGDEIIMEVEGVRLKVTRVEYGYKIEVLKSNTDHFYLHEGFTSTLSDTIINIGMFGYREIYCYYLGYNPTINVCELSLFELFIKGVIE